jgi:hypothetical protein
VPWTRRRPLLIAPVVGVLTLGGCAVTVPVDVAPDATEPVCASVVLAMPDSLGDGLPQRDTTAQATTAWGDPASPVVLRCGVEPLGPTTEHCQTVETPGGASVDWVVVALALPVKLPTVMVAVICGWNVNDPPAFATVSRDAMELRTQ